MYCVGCGKKLEDHELYCTNCGTRVEKSSSESLEKTEILEYNKPLGENNQNNQYNNGFNSNYNNYNQPSNNLNPQNKWPQKLVVALIFGIIAMTTGPLFSVITLILAIIGVVLASKCKEYGSNQLAVIIVNIIGILSSLLGCLIVGLIVIGLLFSEESSSTNNSYTNNNSNNIITEDNTKYIENTWYCGNYSNVNASNYSLIMNFSNGSYEWLSGGRTQYIRGTYDIQSANYGIYKYRLIYKVEETSLDNISSGSYYYMNVEKDNLQLYSSGSKVTYYCTTSLGSQNQL